MDDHSPASKRVLVLTFRAGMLLFGLVTTGCATAKGHFVECPLSVAEQQQAIREIVPIGTSREQAADRLMKEGVEFTTAAGNSIYYCATWKRPDGTQWHMNVAMLFDRDNNLYQLREANSVAQRETAPSSESTSRASPAQTGNALNSPDTADSSNSTMQEPDRIPFSQAVRRGH